MRPEAFRHMGKGKNLQKNGNRKRMLAAGMAVVVRGTGAGGRGAANAGALGAGRPAGGPGALAGGGTPMRARTALMSGARSLRAASMSPMTAGRRVAQACRN